MVIQKIIFPDADKCTEQELYFRQMDAADGADSREDCREGRLALRKGKRIWFDTYFNGFFPDKWKKYTKLDNLFIRLFLQGKVRVTFLSRELVHSEVLERNLDSMVVESAQVQELVFFYDMEKARGMLAFALEALEEGSILHAGAYCSDIPAGKLRDIRIGVGICTYRREAYVKQTLRMLREEILENPESPLYGRMEVFIADNGRSLDQNGLQTQGVHIYPNRNLGGTGGFTRALIEMKMKMKRNGAGHGLTHALLLDDDVVIEPEAFVRTYLVLALAREEYADAFVGGAMLRMDRPFLQRESGAVWNQGELAPLKSGLDLRDCRACLDNEREERSQYNAWWYCCFPLRVVTGHNLPLPFFIKEDDVEYGLRNMRHLILMNGICVWHEPFEKKYSPYLQYYIIRNMLITNAFHCPEYSAWQLNVQTLYYCMHEIAYFRYKNVDVFLRGIQDFLKGPQWLLRQDGGQLHQEVLAMSYQWQRLDMLGLTLDQSTYGALRAGRGRKRLLVEKVLALGGLLLPAKGEEAAPVYPDRQGMHSCRSRRVVYYREADGQAFVAERSLGRTARCMLRVVWMLVVNACCLKKAQQAYRKDGKKLRSIQFWKRYLDLGQS